jgi:hypothetical protein
MLGHPNLRGVFAGSGAGLALTRTSMLFAPTHTTCALASHAPHADLAVATGGPCAQGRIRLGALCSVPSPQSNAASQTLHFQQKRAPSDTHRALPRVHAQAATRSRKRRSATPSSPWRAVRQARPPCSTSARPRTTCPGPRRARRVGHALDGASHGGRGRALPTFTTHHQRKPHALSLSRARPRCACGAP